MESEKLKSNVIFQCAYGVWETIDCTIKCLKKLMGLGRALIWVVENGRWKELKELVRAEPMFGYLPTSFPFLS